MRSPHKVTRRLARSVLHGAVVVSLAAFVAWLVGGRGWTRASAQTADFLRVRITQRIDAAVGSDAGPNSMALININNDGFLDLIAVGRDEGVVFVFRGVGDGTFTEPQTIDVDVTPSAVAVADVGSTFGSNSQGAPDGNLDIIVADEDADDGAEVLFNTGEGTFESPDEGPDLSDLLGEGESFVGIVVGDFDGQNGNDLALLDDSGEGSRVFFLCNNNTGNFTPCATDVVNANGEGPVDIGIGNFDGNTFPDIVVLNRGTENYSVLFGAGGGNFTEDPPTFDALGDSEEVGSLDVARVNNDQLDDFVIANVPTDVEDGIRVAYGPRFPGPFQDFFGQECESIAVAVGDLNGDGAPEAALAYVPVGDESATGPQVLIGDGTGGFLETGFDNPAGSAQMGAGLAILIGNIGGDSLADIVFLSVDLAEDTTTIFVAENVSNMATPTGGIETPATATATMTGPPPPTNTPTATVPTTTATATATATQIPVNYGRCHVQVQGALAGIATGQFDGDGSPDIAVTDPTNSQVSIIFNTAQVQGQLRTCAMMPPVLIEQPIVVPITNISVGTGPGAVAAIDIERDGDVDLLVAEPDGIQILRNSGGVFTAESALTAGTRPAAIAVDYPIDPLDPSRRAPLDLNSDGRTDIVVANAGSSFLSIFYGRDDGLTTASVSIPGMADSVTVADFDQDGQLDIVAGRGSDALLLDQQGRDAANQSQFLVTTFGAGGRIVALSGGFFDGNRSPDVLITRAQGLGQLYLFSGSTLAASGEFQTGSDPTASGVGLFNPTDGNADAVISSREDGSTLSFGLGDGSGMFSAPVVKRGVRGRPAALSVVNIDGDGMEDVVTANGDGTISVLLSSALPPTPTPFSTATLTPTPTPSETGTPGDTPTETPTPSATPPMTDTPADTPTRTLTPSPVNTPKEGAFELSGTGCSIEGTPGRFPAEVVALSLLLAVMRWSRRPPQLRSRGTGRLLLAGAGIATLFASPAPSARAQSLPTYVTCRVGSSTLGATNSGLNGGAVGDFDNNRSPDLALIDSDKIVIARTEFSVFKMGKCAEAITPGSVIAQSPSAVAVGLIDGDATPDLAVAQSGSIALFNGDGAGGFAAAGTQAIAGPLTVAVDSLTNDGLTDLVAGRANSVELLFGRAQGGYTAGTPLTLGNQQVLAVRPANFAGDTQLDIATVDLLGTVRVFVQTTPGSFASPVTFSIGAFPTDMQVADPRTTGDFNGDSIPDLAFVGNDTASSAGTLRVFLGRRTAGVLDFVAQPAIPAGTGPSALGLADLNGDGRLDAAVTDAASAEVLFFLGNGAGGLSISGDPRDTEIAANGILLADVDDDNRDDVITTNGDGSLTIFLSGNPPPTATFTPTLTSVPTGTITQTPESTATLTPSDTPSLTPTQTITRTQTPTRTPEPTRTVTETPITPGIFAVQGEGCAHVGAGGSASDAMPLVILAALALLRRRGQR